MQFQAGSGFNRVRHFVLLVLFASSTLLAQDPKDRGFHQRVVWTSSQGREAMGVWSSSFSEKGSANRLVLEGPSGQLVEMTKILDANRGVQRIRLEVGFDWWIELIQEYGVRWPNYQIALRSLAAGPDSPDMDGSVQIKLETSNGFENSASLPRTLGGEIPDFIEVLEKNR